MINRKLTQCTPMIHFQAGEEGATLRATEVKPKLDRFIYRWCKKKGIKIETEWLVEAKVKKEEERHRALDYKLRFAARGKVVVDLPDNLTAKGLFFGNMGVRDDEKRRYVFYEEKEKISMSILCLHMDLEKIIEECIDLFFLTTNFGTRQDKGFGGFVTEKWREAEGELPWWFGANRVYKLQYPDKTGADWIMSDIKTIYQILKSGVNNSRKTKTNSNYYIKSFLTEYFQGKGIGGEKKYLKDTGVGTVVYEAWNQHLKDKDHWSPKYRRYIRALLGVCEDQSWFYDEKKRNEEKRVISFECEKKGKEAGLARVPSPLLFKVVESNLYIMLVDLPANVYGTKFSFSRYRIEKINYKKIKVPEVRSSDAEQEADRALAIPSSSEMNEWGINMENVLSEYIQALNGGEGNTIRKKMQQWEDRDKPQFIKKNLRFEPVG